MPEDLANRRFQRLQNQYKRLESEIADLDTYVPISGASVLIGDVESILEKTRRLQNQLTKTESGSDDFKFLYDRYTASLDKLDLRLDELHYRTGFLELHASQSNGKGSEELAEISEVCEEILPVFNLDIEVLPVIWESYSTTYLDTPENGQEAKIHLVQIPRQQNSDLYYPLIAHEIAHPLYQRHEVPLEFRKKVRDFDEDWGGSPGEFANKWRDWYMEFFCDAAGVLTFGPAFIFSLAEYLHHQTPFSMSGGRFDTHPPKALRLDSMIRLGERVCSSSLWTRTQPFIDRVDQHLELQGSTKDETYDTYVNPELLSDIHDHVLDVVDNELDLVESELQTYTGKDGVNNDLRNRTISNKEWFAWLADLD